MRNLTRIFFCTFAMAFFYSCEPEEIPADNIHDRDIIAETGDQEGEVVYKEDDD